MENGAQCTRAERDMVVLTREQTKGCVWLDVGP
jgi:hypothetical protein